jgi:hypothetical protein
MKRYILPTIAMLLVLAFALSAQADLFDRGGGMVYSDEMDLTWLLDANYARTSGYDADGYMTWTDANNWAENLVFGGYDDWRLPTFDPDYNREDVLNDPVAAADLSEMAYLRFEELVPPNDYNSISDPGPFVNLIDLVNWEEPWYWSGSPDVGTPELDYWRFDFN